MKKFENFDVLDWASIVLALFLVIVTLGGSFSYGVYNLLRIYTAIVAACWAFRFYVLKNTPLVVISGAIAILFQPIFKITLDKGTWGMVDILLAIALVIATFLVSPNKKAENKE